MNKLILILNALSLALTIGANADTLKTAEDLIAEAIVEQVDEFDPEARFEAKIQKGKAAITAETVETVELSDIEVNSERKSFKGYLVINETISQEIAGKYNKFVKVPAINKKLRRNDIITEQHITYVELEQGKLSRGYILDELELIGKSPIRTLFKNRPVMPKQVAEPNIVERKQAVTMLFENAAMRIQDMGVAMEDGSMNEFIRVRNSNSNTIIHAKVIGEGLVQVRPNQSLASAGSF